MDRTSVDIWARAERQGNTLLIPDPKAIHQWTEPAFFLLRISTWKGWLARAVCFLGFYGLFIGVLLSDNNSPSQPPLGIFEIAVISAIATGVFFVIFELPTVQRQFTLTDNSITCNGGILMIFGGIIHMFGLAFGSWNRREIKNIKLLRVGEPGNRFGHGLMVIYRKHSQERVNGIPNTESLDELANRFHSVNLPVELSNWTANSISSNDHPELD